MSTVTFAVGHVPQSNDLVIGAIDARHPIRKAHNQIMGEKIVGTDFVSGDDLVFELEGVGSVWTAVFTTNVGAIKAFVEAALTAPTVGRKLTLSVCTTNIKYTIFTDN